MRSLSKYPPAEPGALGFGSRSKRLEEEERPPSWKRPMARRRVVAYPSSLIQPQHKLSRTIIAVAPPVSLPTPEDVSTIGTAGNVKLLLPPRQSRGSSLGVLGIK